MSAVVTAGPGLGRVGFLKVFFTESEKLDSYILSLLGKRLHTKQDYEIMKSLIGLGPAVATKEGDRASYDSITGLFANKFTPIMYTKALKVSSRAKFTDQYNIISTMQKHIAVSFNEAANQAAADVLNLGWSSTSMGMNNESLFSSTHSNGAWYATASNVPTTNSAFGPLTLESAIIDLRKQRSAKGAPLAKIGKIDVLVPQDLEPVAYRVIETPKQAGSNVNDLNSTRTSISYSACPYFTSTTAWFLKTGNPEQNGLFWLDQMPYDIDVLSKTDELMIPYVGSQSFCGGWADWRGCSGNQGA